MKFLCILLILGFLSACNEKETQIIELDPPITPIQEEVERIVEAAPIQPIVEPEPIQEVVEEVIETVQETVESAEDVI